MISKRNDDLQYKDSGMSVRLKSATVQLNDDHDNSTSDVNKDILHYMSTL